MRISASRRVMARQAFAAARRAYSLLEVLIVVALLGLAVAISGPSLGRMIERQQAQQTLKAGAAALSELRVEAFVTGTDYRSEQVQERVNAALATGWSSEVPETLAFRRSGYCQGGQVRIVEPSGRVWVVPVEDGDCAIQSVRPGTAL